MTNRENLSRASVEIDNIVAIGSNEHQHSHFYAHGLVPKIINACCASTYTTTVTMFKKKLSRWFLVGH